jgi:hypothetical protein
MSKQLHKNFTDGQVKSLLKSYLDKKIKINYILQMLRIKRSRFFELLSQYRKDSDNFSIQYDRRTINRKIDPEIDKNMVKELKIEKDLIKNKDVPIRYYNYSYIKDLLEQKYGQKVSLPTLIDRAKRNNFYFERLNRTYKLHTKAAGGFNSVNGAIALTTLFFTYYNFLQPHTSLNYPVPIPLETLREIDTLCEFFNMFPPK